MNEIILEVKNLSKRFNGLLAVDSVNFTVKKGEVFAFLGPNGAGKTTTINMLTGLARPTSGSIFYLGKEYTAQIKKAQSIIGIVPDENNLYDDLTGFENLCFCASLYGIKKKERESKAEVLLEHFSLTDAAGKEFKYYSKGMKRKLTIAAGIINDPEILFLDEPTTGIDVASARQVRELVQKLNSFGTTIFMTTHYIEEAERLCSRVAFIVKGKIIRTGSLSEMMRETQKQNILQFAFANEYSHTDIFDDFKNEFKTVEISSADSNTVKITSTDILELMPIMIFFDKRGIKVWEAKIIRPTLEEVFIKITGIEIKEMKIEKENKR